MDKREKILKITGQEKVFRPTLLQTFHATVSMTTYSTAADEDSGYIEPNRAIAFNHLAALEPDDVAFYLQEQGYFFYEGDYFYRRGMDGQLIERANDMEPDYAAEMDGELFTKCQDRWANVSVFSVDMWGNLYCIEYGKYRDILVASQEGDIYGKFHLAGIPMLWYLTLDGRVCILTSNGASDPGKKKNILRLYRLDQPDRI